MNRLKNVDLAEAIVVVGVLCALKIRNVKEQLTNLHLQGYGKVICH